MQQGQEAGQPPLPPYATPEAGPSSGGWPHHEQQVMTTASSSVPEGWQHGGWAQPADAWGFAQPSSWGHQQAPMAGGYAIPGQMPPQAVQYYAVQQQNAANQVQLPQHQGGVIFLCDPRTEEECLQRGLFGLPATQTQIVRAIVPEATLLFLFNVSLATATCLPPHAYSHARESAPPGPA